jgi:mannose-1-phosphate guanylyltransferase
VLGLTRSKRRGEFRVELGCAASGLGKPVRRATLGRMASAIVLCAGFGTRLRPLTDELPKALAPVGDRSVLAHALTALGHAGFRSAVVNVHHLSASFERHIEALKFSVQVVVEGEIKGTAGGVAGARQLLSSGPVLVWNGDILVEPPIDALLGKAEEEGICLAVAPRASGCGTLGLDAEGRVVRLRGEHFGSEVSGGDYVGVLSLGNAARDSLPEQGCLFADAALPRLRAGGTVASVCVAGPWIDAGDVGGLLRANLAWLAAHSLQSFLGEHSFVAPGVVLRDSVLCAGARVQGSGLFERCVVCAGAIASAPLMDAIVTPSGRVLHVRA